MATSKILNNTKKSHILRAGGWDFLPLSDYSLGDKGTEEAFPFADDDWKIDHVHDHMYDFGWATTLGHFSKIRVVIIKLRSICDLEYLWKEEQAHIWSLFKSTVRLVFMFSCSSSGGSTSSEEDVWLCSSAELSSSVPQRWPRRCGDSEQPPPPLLALAQLPPLLADCHHYHHHHHHHH